MWVASLCAALSVLTLAVVVSAQWRAWRPLRRRRVVVQTIDGAAFDAVLAARRGPLLMLADVTVRVAGGEQRIDGSVAVERDRVAYVQVIG